MAETTVDGHLTLIDQPANSGAGKVGALSRKVDVEALPACLDAILDAVIHPSSRPV